MDQGERTNELDGGGGGANRIKALWQEGTSLDGDVKEQAAREGGGRFTAWQIGRHPGLPKGNLGSHVSWT